MSDVMRQRSADLKEQTMGQINYIKKLGNEFHNYISGPDFHHNREMELAKTKLEECVMWAVKSVSIVN